MSCTVPVSEASRVTSPGSAGTRMLSVAGPMAVIAISSASSRHGAAVCATGSIWLRASIIDGRCRIEPLPASEEREFARLLLPLLVSQRPRGRVEPGPRGGVEQRAQYFLHVRVVAVDPVAFLGGQQAAVDQPPVDRRQRERLKRIDRLLGGLGLGDRKST